MHKLKEITYYVNGKKKKIHAQIIKHPYISSGLMFRKNSPPLLFPLKKEKSFTISSLFCKPFIAIWLDGKMNATKIVRVKNWTSIITGHGKYLLEIPITPEK